MTVDEFLQMLNDQLEKGKEKGSEQNEKNEAEKDLGIFGRQKTS